MLNLGSKYSFAKILGVYTIWWLFWSCIQLFVMHRLGLDWELAIVDSLVSNLLLEIIVLITLMVYRYYKPGRTNRVYRLIWGVAISAVYCILIEWTLSLIYASNPDYLNFLQKSIPIRFIYVLMTMAYMTLVSWLWNKMNEQKETDKRQTDLEKLMKDAELSKLRQQLQPHFLFNSLNSISALILSKPDQAQTMIHQLSDFLRGTLRDEQESITLQEELAHLQLYLEIEKVRFGHRLTVAIDTEEKSLTCKLPSLLLQPIVENAIKFGLYDVSEAITIRIRTHVQGAFLIVNVSNPFDAQTANANKGLGFGLHSITRRLHLLYARHDLLVTTKEASTFITTLKIPQAS